MVTVRFREVKLTRKVRVACAGGCGKKLARQQTFWQTLNPFNTNAEGQPKTSSEIYAELDAEADAWQPVATCPACVAAPTYRCTFTDGRIGRTHGVEPLTVRAADGDILAERVFAYARPHLRSRDVETFVNLDEMRGFVRCGFQSGASFTIDLVEPAKAVSA